MNQSSNDSSSGGVSRRDFIRTTSSVAIGGTVFGALAGCKTNEKKTAATTAALAVATAAHAAGSDTLKLALIGCGGRGSGAANQALNAEGVNVKLVAMGDAFPDHLEKSLGHLKTAFPDKVDVPKDNQFTGFDAYKKAIALADVVILATPPGFRPIHFEEAVRQGKHVFMEKPVATDAPGVRKVLAAAEEAKKKNLKVGVGLQRRHQLGYIETMNRLRDGAIGDIVSMRAYWNGNTPWVHPRADLEKQFGRKLTEMEYQMRNWYYFTWICGDHICEQHIHNLDVINWMKNGHPVRARGNGGCETRKGPDYGEIFDHHIVEFEYADGSTCFSQCRHQLGCWNEVAEYGIGSKGRVHLDDGHWRITGQNPWKFEGKQARERYQQEHDDLFAAIRDDKPYNEAEYGATSTMTAILGRMSTYSGKSIEWDEAIKSEISLLPKEFSWDADMPVKPMANGLYQLPVPGKTVVI